INQQINNRYRGGWNNRPFSSGWWGGHGGGAYRHAHYHGWRHGHHGAGHWWRWATAGALTGWIAYARTRPVYYSYGTDGNVYYEDDTVYVDGNAVGSSEEYYQQAETLATALPEVSEAEAEKIEWMPLGVFAITEEGVNETNRLLQLTVSKEGVISGTLFNETTGSTRPVEGQVDRETQRAAWTFADDKESDVVMETGIYNLTEDESTLLVHFGPTKTQSWVMVRLDEPKEGEASQPGKDSGG
ncbi:MAG: hypothetical protein ACC645_12315, partial [Pirellulales bacterium]